MYVYEITLYGFDDNGTQDHLVKWIKAPDREAVERFVLLYGLLRDSRDQTKCIGNKYGIDDGVDVIIDVTGHVSQGDIGETRRRIYKKKADVARSRVKGAISETIEALQEYNSEDAHHLTVELTSELIEKLREALLALQRV